MAQFNIKDINREDKKERKQEKTDEKTRVKY